MERNEQMNPIKWHEKRLEADISVHAEIFMDRVYQNPERISELILWGTQNNVGSPATLHKSIHELIFKGFAEIIVDEKDGRKKVIHITKSGKTYLGK